MIKQLLIFVMMICIVGSAFAYDDFPNYVRGTVFYPNGSTAGSNTKIIITVTSGVHKDSTFVTYVDSKYIPPVFYGKGYYSTNDQVIFDLGESFTIYASDGKYYATAKDTFNSPGTGAWKSNKLNLVLDKPVVADTQRIEHIPVEAMNVSVETNVSSYVGEIVKYTDDENATRANVEVSMSYANAHIQPEKVFKETEDNSSIYLIIGLIIFIASIIGLTVWMVKRGKK